MTIVWTIHKFIISHFHEKCRKEICFHDDYENISINTFVSDPSVQIINSISIRFK